MAIKVLVVDDSPIIFKIIKRSLEPQGFELVGHADNGKIGLEMVDQFKPDIITLDVTMPIMDGLEMAENLFQSKSEATVILMSAMGDDDLIVKAQKFGVKHFLTKPVNGEELIKLINTIMGN
jgi:two-component system, chemotaxis family, chemotaxis protein CheY